jgi:hypothetical protein
MHNQITFVPHIVHLHNNAQALLRVKAGKLAACRMTA